MSESWQQLKLGDIVDVVAPGFKPDETEFKEGLGLLADWGIEPRYPKDIFSKDLLCANSCEKRRYFFRQALTAPDSKIIWCARGGYGSVDVLDELKFMKKPKRVKLLVGYSDITVLHNFLVQKWDWPVLHAPLIDGLGSGKPSSSSIKFLKDVLFKDRDMTFGLKSLNASALKSKSLSGRVLGGNLAMLQSTLGTDMQIELSNGFLFLEDIGERGYKVERMLKHLEQATKFKGLKAIVFGEFIGGEEPDGKSLVDKVLLRWAQGKDLPIYSGVPSGHGKNQHPLFINTPARLEGGEKPALLIKPGARSL